MRSIKKIFQIAFLSLCLLPTITFAAVTGEVLPADIKATVTITNTGTTDLSVKVLWGENGSNPDNGSTPVAVPAGSAAPYEITGLIPSTTYYYILQDANSSTTNYTTVAAFTTHSAGEGYDLEVGAGGAQCSEGRDGYCLLEPLGGVSTISNTELPDYLNILYKIGIGIAGVLAVIMLVFGGIQYMSTDALTGKEHGRERMGKAIIGLLLALGSWVILNTVNPKLLNFDFNIATAEITIDPSEIDRDGPHAPENGKYCPAQNGGYDAGYTWDANNSESTIRAALVTSQITVKDNPPCTAVGNNNCTSVSGLNTSGVLSIREKCPDCELVITGGTECWLHSNKTKHGKGSPTIDLRKTGSAKLLEFIHEDKNPVKIKNWGMQYTVQGIQFVDEGDHLHIRSFGQ